MIQIPVVGQYDSTTKEHILAGKGAVTMYSVVGNANVHHSDTLFKQVADIWPASSTYEIVDRYGTRFGSPWYMPIDLGDDVKLHIKEFMDMCVIQLSDEQRTRDGIIDYLKALIGADMEIYKLMVKMGKLNGI